jgi:hypothetical protein
MSRMMPPAPAPTNQACDAGNMGRGLDGARACGELGEWKRGCGGGGEEVRVGYEGEAFGDLGGWGLGWGVRGGVVVVLLWVWVGGVG